MPATVIHAAVFTAGALIGGSLAAIATRRNSPLPRQPSQREDIETDARSGRTQLPESPASLAAQSILKYGNPGKLLHFFAT